MNLIQAREVFKSYWNGPAETPVLKGVDFEIGSRDLVAIVGASGAGKSTLLHILGSLDAPSSGTVSFDGASLYDRNDEDLARLRNESIGFVFQFHHLLPEFSALENVMMPLLIRGEGRRRSEEKARALLQRLGLQDRSSHRPTELSGGEQQRVAVARALIGSPRILFADEPTGNLDHENSENLIRLLLEIHQEHHMALVLVTHNEAIASRFSKKIRMEDGQIVWVNG